MSVIQETPDQATCSAAMLATAAQPSQLADLTQVPVEQLTRYLTLALSQLHPPPLSGVAPVYTSAGLTAPTAEVSYRTLGRSHTSR